MSNLLLYNAAILTIDPDDRTYEHGFICVQGNRIEAVGPSEALPDLGDFAAYRKIDCCGKIIMPGMINTHCHMSMMAFRSLADDVPDRLRRYLFPLESRAMNQELAVISARYALAELLLGGVTTIYDAYFFEDDIAETVAASGMRGVLSETVMNIPTPNAATPYGGISYTRGFIEKWKGHSRIVPAVNCHAIYTNDTEHLQECHRIAAEHDVTMCMHVAEMDFEQQKCLDEYGLTPVGYLNHIGILDERFLAAHAIHVDDHDLEIMAGCGVNVSYNAGSNAKSAKGVAPVAKMVAKGIPVSLGTDGPMSGNTIDIVSQLPLVGKIQKLFQNDRSLFPPSEILRMATINGAKALRLDHLVGSLERGKRADIVIFETDSVNMNPIYDYNAVIVYSANPANVWATIVDGEILMENRTLLTMDFELIKQNLLSSRTKIETVARTLEREIAANG